MIQCYFYMFDVMLFYISLPSWPNNNNTLCITVAHERFSVLRVNHRGQKSGHLWPAHSNTHHIRASPKTACCREIVCTEASITAGLNV